MSYKQDELYEDFGFWANKQETQGLSFRDSSQARQADRSQQ